MATDYLISNPSSRPAHSEDLRRAVGCLCEVRNPDSNRLIFLARVRNFDGRAVTVLPTGGRETPPVLYNAEYKLVLRIPDSPALVWRGLICGSTRSFWKLDHLSRCHHKEQRGNFRQPIQARATALCINALYPGAPVSSEAYYSRTCRVLDISLGGIQLQCEDLYSPGDYLAIMNLYLESSSSRPFLFTVRIRWAEQIPGQRFCRCGCSFEPMSVQEEDRLCAAILSLQREDIAAH